MRLENNNNSTSFTALPRAIYSLPTGEQIKILELEAKDLPYIRDFSKNIKKFMDAKEIESVTDKRLIIDTSFKIIKEMLERITKFGTKENKTRMFIAESNSEICGVLVGGLPKRTPNGKIMYSSRKGCDKKETELNWLATWNPNAKTQRKGVGKIILSEFIDTLEKDGFNKAFIQSEIPELSFAQKFYEKLGFKPMKCGQKPHSQIEKNKDIVTCVEDLYDYEVVPMLGNVKNIDKAKNEVFQSYERKPLTEKPIELKNYLA